MLFYKYKHNNIYFYKILYVKTYFVDNEDIKINRMVALLVFMNNENGMSMQLAWDEYGVSM